MFEAVLKLSIVFKIAGGVSGSQQVHKVSFSDAKQIENVELGELNLEEFVASKLREVGDQVLELGNKVHSFSSKEHLESALVQQMKEVVAKLLTVCRVVVGVWGNWWVQKLMTAAQQRV